MKKMNVVLMIGLLLPHFIQAQGTLYVSNLGQPTIDSMSIGSDSWVAQYFTTGTNADGYILNSVQLLMGAASGNPNGFTVSIYSSPGNGAPGSSLGSLSGSDPAAGGLFTYTTSGIMLSPSTLYFVVVTAATPAAQGAYDWSAVFGNSNRSGDGWIISAGYYGSSDGSSWQFSRDDTFQLAIYATAIPEPATLALAGLGHWLALSFWAAQTLSVRQKSRQEHSLPAGRSTCAPAFEFKERVHRRIAVNPLDGFAQKPGHRQRRYFYTVNCGALDCIRCNQFVNG